MRISPTTTPREAARRARDIDRGTLRLREALAMFNRAPAPQTAAYTRRALKSAGGAARHAGGLMLRAREAAERMAAHRAADPHCTCPDCVAFHTGHLTEQDETVDMAPSSGAVAPVSSPAIVHVLTEESNGSSGDGPDNVVLSTHATEEGAKAARDAAAAARRQEGKRIWGDEPDPAEDSPGLQALSAADVDEWDYDFHIEALVVEGHPDPLAAEVVKLQQLVARIKAVFVDGRGRWIQELSGGDVIEAVSHLLDMAGHGGTE